jgi:hypothetical protein
MVAKIRTKASGLKHPECSEYSGTLSDSDTENQPPRYARYASLLDDVQWKCLRETRRIKTRRKSTSKRESQVKTKRRRRQRRKAKRRCNKSASGGDGDPGDMPPLPAPGALPLESKLSLKPVPQCVSVFCTLPTFEEAACGGADRDELPVNYSISFGDLGGPLCGIGEPFLPSRWIPPTSPPASPPIAPWLGLTKHKSHFGKLIDTYLSIKICQQFANQGGVLWEAARKVLEPHFLHPVDLTKSEFLRLLRANSIDSWLEENVRRLESRIIERRIKTHYALIAAGIIPPRMPDRQLESCELMSEEERSSFIKAYKRMEGQMAVFQHGLKLTENQLQDFIALSEVDRNVFVDLYNEEEQLIREQENLKGAMRVEAEGHGILQKNRDADNIQDVPAVAENPNEPLDEIQARTALSESERTKGAASSELGQLVLTYPDAIELLSADPTDIVKWSSMFEKDEEKDKISNISSRAQLIMPYVSNDAGCRSVSVKSTPSCEDSTLQSHDVRISAKSPATSNISPVLEASTDPTQKSSMATEEETTPRPKTENIPSISPRGSSTVRLLSDPSSIFTGYRKSDTENTLSILELYESLEIATKEPTMSQHISFESPRPCVKVVQTINDANSLYARNLDGISPVGHIRSEVQYVEYRGPSTNHSRSPSSSRCDDLSKKDESPRTLRKSFSKLGLKVWGSLRLKKVRPVNGNSSINF